MYNVVIHNFLKRILCLSGCTLSSLLSMGFSLVVVSGVCSLAVVSGVCSLAVVSGVCSLAVVSGLLLAVASLAAERRL